MFIRIAVSVTIGIISFFLIGVLFKRPEPLIIGSGEIRLESHRLRFSPKGVKLFCGEKLLYWAPPSPGASFRLNCPSCKNIRIFATFSAPRSAAMREFKYMDDGEWYAGKWVTTPENGEPK